MSGEPEAKTEPMCDRCPEHLAIGKLKAKTELRAYGIMFTHGEWRAKAKTALSAYGIIP